MNGYHPYWIFPMDGDPLPNIGSGLRRVTVRLNEKKQTVTVRGANPEIVDKIPLTRWEGIAHIPDTGDMDFNTLITRLRRYYLSPCGKGECNV